MAEEQPPVLTEKPQEETTRAEEDGTQESHGTSVSEDEVKEDSVQDNVPEEEHQGEEQTKEDTGKEVTEKGGGEDAVTSTEDSGTSDGDKAEANEESSSTLGESSEDMSSHKVEESGATAGSPEVTTAKDGEGKSQPSAKDKAGDRKPAPSSAKEGPAATRSKDAGDRKSEIPRARTMPKSIGRATKKEIAEKFGGVATSGVRVQRSTSCGAGAVKNMLLQWCQAKTREREGVDIQNFSSSWSDGLAFCALIVAFFPDAFDYDSLDPKNRRQNFQLAFSAAEKFADCPPLLDVEDMVRMKVPDSKCVYTYVQELYRSLVAKGLVKTKKA
ncbi:hypothetical protein GDO81_017651 [Engystomops pustulosus]|uniref:Calponin-homology (CH) domain-containing protein n=1 Tax=Engystomops pustulosus TaxID=76066 RepID=A0AAV7A679_ENGPU|nr:hypothetical protein GDO81_017651 [Engystomops pustulosus]